MLDGSIYHHLYHVTRLLNLEKKIVLHSGDTPPAVWDMRAKVEKLREQLETVEHLSWLGFYKDLDG